MSQKFFCLGAEHLTGISKKDQSPFDFCVLHTAVQPETVTSKNFQSVGFGVKQEDINIDIAMYRQLSIYSYPCLIDFEIRCNHGRITVASIVPGQEKLKVAV